MLPVMAGSHHNMVKNIVCTIKREKRSDLELTKDSTYLDLISEKCTSDCDYLEKVNMLVWDKLNSITILVSFNTYDTV